MNRSIAALVGVIMSLGMVGHAQAATCTENTPVTTVTTIGGGQSQSTNEVMYAEFTGHITTTSGLTSGGKNTVKICEGTTVTYRVVGGKTLVYTLPGVPPQEVEQLASCLGASATGSLSPGDKLVCKNNNLGGNDTDRYRVVGVK